MKRPIPTAAMVVLLLAGCATADGDGRRAGIEDRPQDQAEPEVEWSTSYRDHVVRVTIEDPNAHYRVERVVLLGPGGAVHPAAELTRENVTDSDARSGGFYPSVGVGGGYSSGGGFGTGLGIGIGFPLGGSEPAAPDIRTTSARLPVPDPDLYRRTVGQWEIEATMTTPAGETRYARIPAPVPAEPAPIPASQNPAPAPGETTP